MPQPQTSSRIAVERVAGQSRLTSCRSIAPLKILNPRAEGDYAAAVLSSYGGGLVAGDCAHLEVDCGPQAKLFLGTQAFTKVYKTADGEGARQVIEGGIAAQGSVVALPDPVVPYADSVFLQEQTWQLEQDALLVLLDSATAGRSERGEDFQYRSYTSNITVYREDQPVLIERFEARPGDQPLGHAGTFGEYTAFANAFIVGAPDSQPFSAMEEGLRQRLAPQLAAQLDGSSDQGPALVSLVLNKPGVLVLRALGRNSQALDDSLAALTATLAQSDLLGANPLQRKY